MFKLKNLAKGTLSTQLLSGGGTFSLQSGEGAKFPDTGSDNVFVGVFWSNSFASPEADSNAEFVTSYRTSGDAFSVTRAQEGTSAHQWEIGDNFSLVASSAVFSELNETKVTKADSSSDNAIVKFDGVDGDTIQNSGVFIGDDNTLAVNGPNTNVSINGANVTGGLGVWVDDGGTNKAGIGIGKADSTSALAGATYYGARSRGTLSTPEIIENGDLMTAMVGLGYDGSTFRLGSRINQEVDGTPGSADMPGRITFHTTADGAIVPTERMRIDKTGNVGIGTDNPVAKVDVAGTMRASGVVTSTVGTGTAPFSVSSTTKNTNLNADLLDGANLSTDGTLASNSDGLIPSEKAVKTYADTKLSSSEKATGAEINTGTDDAKFVTAKAIADSNILFTNNVSVARLGRQVSYSFPNATWTSVTFTTKDFQNGADITADLGGNRLIFNKTGVYYIAGYINFHDGSTGDRGLRFSLNGSTNPMDSMEFFVGKDSNGRWRYFAFMHRTFTAGDYIKLDGYQNGGSVTLDASFLSAHFISE